MTGNTSLSRLGPRNINLNSEGWVCDTICVTHAEREWASSPRHTSRHPVPLHPVQPFRAVSAVIERFFGHASVSSLDCYHDRIAIDSGFLTLTSIERLLFFHDEISPRTRLLMARERHIYPLANRDRLSNTKKARV